MKKYVRPELDIVEFQLNIDIVTESDGYDDPFGWGSQGTGEILLDEPESYDGFVV